MAELTHFYEARFSKILRSCVFQMLEFYCDYLWDKLLNFLDLKMNRMQLFCTTWIFCLIYILIYFEIWFPKRIFSFFPTHTSRLRNCLIVSDDLNISQSVRAEIKKEYFIYKIRMSTGWSINNGSFSTLNNLMLFQNYLKFFEYVVCWYPLAILL